MGNISNIHHEVIFKLGYSEHTSWSCSVLVLCDENFTGDENVRDVRVVWSVTLRGKLTLTEARKAIKKALSIPLEHLGVTARISDGSGIDGYGVNVLFFVSRKQLELWNEPDFRSAISCFADELNKILASDGFGLLEPVNLGLPNRLDLDTKDGHAIELDFSEYNERDRKYFDSLEKEFSRKLDDDGSLDLDDIDIPKLDDPDDL